MRGRDQGVSIAVVYCTITKCQACARHIIGWTDNLIKGNTPSKGMSVWLAGGGVLGCFPKSGCPPTSPWPGGGDHLPQKGLRKQPQGSGGRRLVWGCCRCLPAAPRSAPAPIFAEPPRITPCLSTGQREGRVRPQQRESSRPCTVSLKRAPKDKNEQGRVGRVLITF